MLDVCLCAASWNKKHQYPIWGLCSAKLMSLLPSCHTKLSLPLRSFHFSWVCSNTRRITRICDLAFSSLQWRTSLDPCNQGVIDLKSSLCILRMFVLITTTEAVHDTGQLAKTSHQLHTKKTHVTCTDFVMKDLIKSAMCRRQSSFSCETVLDQGHVFGSFTFWKLPHFTFCLLLGASAWWVEMKRWTS